MRKAEMEHARAVYEHELRLAKVSIKEGDVLQAIEHAVQGWRFVVGMMKHARKYDGAEFESLACVDIVLEHAPYVFDAASLNALGELLTSERSVERNTSSSLKDRLAEARESMSVAHRIWRAVERDDHGSQDDWADRFGVDAATVNVIVDRWMQLGLVIRSATANGECLRIATNLGDACRAKCALCGAGVRAAKRVFLNPAVCPGCKRQAEFVLCVESLAHHGE